MNMPEKLRLAEISMMDHNRITTNTSFLIFGKACALFFEGAALKLGFSSSDPKYDQGNCSDTLTQCYVDVLCTKHYQS